VSPAAAAIAGLGATEFSRNSGRSELRLTCEAISTALADAGLAFDDVDGLTTSSVDTSDPAVVAETLGLREIGFFSTPPYGGGSVCAAVGHAALAVTAGLASTVVVYRGLNGRSGTRYGQGYADASRVQYMRLAAAYGHLTPAHHLSLSARRWMHEYDISNEDFAPVSVAARRHAATNPAAYFYRQPIAVEDHQSSKWVVEPVLRLLDCCLESDGGVAVVVTSLERARDLRQPAVLVTASGQGLTGESRLMMNYYGDTVGSLPEIATAAQLAWRATGLTSADIRMAILYDQFTPLVLMQLEALGFCKPGESADFVRDGAIEIGGVLPVNTHGGLLGEAYIHGMNGIAEAVRQVRGTAVNQVPGASPVIVTSGPGTPASVLILSAD
jgi:acetyl-CoA acetyltransferase